MEKERREVEKERREVEKERRELKKKRRELLDHMEKAFNDHLDHSDDHTAEVTDLLLTNEDLKV